MVTKRSVSSRSLTSSLSIKSPASFAAAPNPTIAGTFSVPLRSPLFVAATVELGGELSRSAHVERANPFGPYSL